MHDGFGLLSELQAEGAILALLICGHVLGDFVFQTRQMVRRKKKLPWLLFHVVVLTLVQGLVLLPFFPSREAVIAVLVVGLAHLLIDYVRTRLEHSRGIRAGWDVRFFLGDQVAHTAVLIGAWSLLLRPQPGPWTQLAWIDISVVTLTEVALLVAGAAALWNGGSALVRGTLDQVLHRRHGVSTGEQTDGESGQDESEDGEQRQGQPDLDGDDQDRVGELIGKLERILIFALGMIQAWAVIGLYVGTKPFARLKMGGPDGPDDEGDPMGHKLTRDYYLVGTLASVLASILGLIGLELLI